MEVRQMLGRAGRPKYDDYGEAWILCKGTDGWEIADDVSERYFFGEIESISSKLASEPALRTHLLSIISTGGLQHRGDIGDFFESTFLGFSISKNILNERIDEMLNWLVDERFIRRLGVDESYANKRADQGINDDEDWDDEMPVWANIAHSTVGVEFQSKNNSSTKVRSPSAFSEPSFGFKKATELSNVGAWHLDEKNEFSAMKYEATLMGERITQLYLDPLSASLIRIGLRRAVRREVRKSGEVTNFGLLHLIATTPDFSSLWAKNSDMEINSNLWLKTNSVESELLADSSYDEMLLGNVKSAWLIEKWTEEETMRSIEKSLDVSPGDLHHRVDLVSWLLLGSKEILIADDVFSQEHMSEISEIIKKVDILRQRTRHGCKEDLLTLVNIRNIGRSRARELANLGIRTPQQVMSMSSSKRNDLLKLRGWGPLLLSKIITEVEKIISRENNKQSGSVKLSSPRDDDIPLFDEKESDA
jgi:helicase